MTAHCLRCGYDLSHSLDAEHVGTCPECGRTYAPKEWAMCHATMRDTREDLLKCLLVAPGVLLVLSLIPLVNVVLAVAGLFLVLPVTLALAIASGQAWRGQRESVHGQPPHGLAVAGITMAFWMASLVLCLIAMSVGPWMMILLWG